MGVSLVSNPPYNMKWTPPDLAGFIAAYRGWTIPPKNNANYAFILTGLSLIDDKAVFLLPNSCLSSGTKEEKTIRKELVECNLISAVILLPGSMFESTSISVCLLILDKHKTTTKIEMVDMRQCCDVEIRDQNGQFGGSSHTGRTYHKQVNVISKTEMQKSIDAIINLFSEPDYCEAVSPEAIRENDYILTPSRYINHENKEAAHRSFEDIANDYNRIMRQKNAIKIRMNKTAAKRLGYDCMDIERVDLSEAFAMVGQKAEKENNISFSANDGIRIEISTKDNIHPLIIDFLNHWKQMIMYFNNEENRLLAEFGDALLPELMSGKIKPEGDGIIHD